MNERLALLIPKPEVPPKPERPDAVTASYLLDYFKWYVLKDPDRQNVSWMQLFGEKRPSYIEPNSSYKSIRNIDIKKEKKKKKHGNKKIIKKNTFRVVAEAILPEEEARNDAFNPQDPDAHLMFRLTLVSPKYKMNPLHPIDKKHMFARVYVDLGPEGATILDRGDDQTLGYLRRFYNEDPDTQDALMDKLEPLQEEYPILQLFTAPNRHRLREDTAATLKMEHLRIIHDTFLPSEPQDGKAA